MKTRLILKNFIGLLISASLFCGYVNAGIIEVSNGKDETIIFFSNGMFNKTDDIRASLFAMIGLVGETLGKIKGPNETIRCKKVINSNEDPILQFKQVLAQRTDVEDQLHFKRWIQGRDSRPDWIKAGIEEENALEPLVNIVTLENIPSRYMDSDLKAMIDKYLAELVLGHRVIIIAHSQGNMYANMARDIMGLLQVDKVLRNFELIDFS